MITVSTNSKVFKDEVLGIEAFIQTSLGISNIHRNGKVKSMVKLTVT